MNFFTTFANKQNIMARNSLAGKSTGKSKSAKYYASNPKAREKKAEYQKNTTALKKLKSIVQN